jgi:hypothetical protein
LLTFSILFSSDYVRHHRSLTIRTANCYFTAKPGALWGLLFHIVDACCPQWLPAIARESTVTSQINNSALKDHLNVRIVTALFGTTNSPEMSEALALFRNENVTRGRHVEQTLRPTCRFFSSLMNSSRA